MNKKYLVYCCNDIDPVYDSQVIDLLRSINDEKIFKEICLLQGIRNEEQNKEFRKRKIPSDIRVIVYKSYPNYPLYNINMRREISKALKKYGITPEETIFHTRCELLSWHLVMILAKKYQQNILPDIRGTIIEEIKEFRKMPYVLKYLKLWNYKKALKCVSKLKKISVVSDTLKKYMVSKYNMYSENIFITPCLASENFKYDSRQRDLIRRELNICKDDVLIVFSSGSSGLWQKNEVLKILADKEMKIINLSKDNIKHKNIINKYVDYCKVPLYLNAADIAVIWRDKSIVNQAASPVKFSEYICCGLPVIANESVDSITNYISSSSCGLLINNMEDINRANVNKLLSLNHQEIADNGIRRLGVENITNQYLKIYSSF